MQTEHELWKLLHDSEVADAVFSGPLKAMWDFARQADVPYDMDALPCLPADAFQEFKSRSLRLYAYSSRCFALLSKHQNADRSCFALFDTGARLLKLFGSQVMIEQLETSGISRLSDWSLTAIGPSAVSLGLSQGCSISTIGRENYAKPLVDYAVYFAPCIRENSGSSFSEIIGGVAVIIPRECASVSYATLCNAVAYDINLHMFMADTVEESYSSDERGVLNIDFNVKTNRKHVLYHDKNLFKILGIPESNLFFAPLERIIDKTEVNREFWEIVDTRQTVSNLPIDIEIGGRTEHLQMSSESYEQPNLAIRGMRVFLTSPKFLSSKISSNIGKSAAFTFAKLKGEAPNYIAAVQRAKVFSQSDSPILITGQISTGKSTLSQAIHNASSRSAGPYIMVSCSSIPSSQLHSEIFGVEDPVTRQITNIGRLELASGGTLYLDEVGVLPLDVQAGVLHAIKNHEFYRTGGRSAVAFDARVIASSSEDLQTRIVSHQFRADLYHCLNSLNLHLPSLNDRKRDIPLLADLFLAHAKKNPSCAERLTPEAKKTLQQYDWSGNIRQLQSVIEIAALMSATPYIEADQILEYLPDGDTLVTQPFDAGHSSRVSREEILSALHRAHYNKQQAAQELGVSRRTLYRYLEKYAIR